MGPGFRPPLNRKGPRRYKPVDENDPTRKELVRIVALRTSDPEQFERECRNFVGKNYGLAVEFAASYEARHVPLEDLAQSAAIGLLTAIRRFDVSKAGKFSTYAVWWMMHEVNNQLHRRECLVALPANVREDRRRIDWLEAKLAQTVDADENVLTPTESPSSAESPTSDSALAKHLEISVRRVQEARAAYMGHTTKGIDHKRLKTKQEDEHDAETKMALHRALGRLSPDHRAALADEYDLDLGTADHVKLPDSPAALELLRRAALRRLRLELAAD